MSLQNNKSDKPNEKREDWLTAKQTKQNREQMLPLCQCQEALGMISE